MQPYYFKREMKDIARARIVLFGPLNSANQPSEGQQPQLLTFNRGNGSIAGCKLVSGKRYTAYVELIGLRGAKMSATIQHASLQKPMEKAFATSIPANHPGPKSQLGYAHRTVCLFEVSQ